MTLTVGSLFSGIGGLDLGLERAGMEVIWQSEIDPYATRVLAKHWPGVPNHGDIKRIEWSDVVRPDVICGGYPCQPFSLAGARQGEEDPRHLWPWVRDAISVLRPRYAILENVRGHLSLGGTTVLREIAALGYCAEWRIISAASVGANHRRDRVLIVAYPDGLRMEGPRPELEATRVSREGENVADSESGTSGTAEPYGLPEVFGQAAKLREPSGGLRSIASWWETEPDVGRVAHGIPNRVDRLKGLGNAVVPQVAEVIGRLVLEHHNTTTPH
ncbi:MAG: DNA cytosine methyltransferase [Rhodobacteraceae bacterium]|nr:DNA cytosine methyltransferase [Paracoccaceae bacterium]